MSVFRRLTIVTVGVVGVVTLPACARTPTSAGCDPVKVRAAWLEICPEDAGEMGDLVRAVAEADLPGYTTHPATDAAADAQACKVMQAEIDFAEHNVNLAGGEKFAWCAETLPIVALKKGQTVTTNFASETEPPRTVAGAERGYAMQDADAADVERPHGQIRDKDLAGYDGLGQTVVVLDGAVPAGDDTFPKVARSACFVDDGCVPATCAGKDPCTDALVDTCESGDETCARAPASDRPEADVQAQHGAAVVGAILGSPAGAGTQPVGVAPRADVVAVRVLSNQASTTPSAARQDVIRALDWVVKTLVWKQAKRPAAVNMSFGFPCEPGFDFGSYVKLMKSGGVATVAAAGNAGLDADGTTTFLPAPACVADAIAVAAADEGYVELAHWSNRGAEVDIVAPGSRIVVLGHPALDPAADPASPFGHVSGTSIAAAHVTGSIALLQHCYDKATVPKGVAEVRSWLGKSTTVLGGVPALDLSPHVGSCAE